MPVDITNLSPGDLLADKYRVERELGAGGMGAVFLAENVDLGRKVAIKVLLPGVAAHPEAVARFRQEARATAAIGHPGIVDVLDLGRTKEGAEFIVMEHLRGESLSRRLAREGKLPLSLSLEVLIRLADALESAHEREILHRDLKPDNIFLVDAPVFSVKILDFGISKLLGEDQAVRTATGSMMGTPRYMSPEQASTERDLTPASDLYTLGVIAYEMLCGRTPFESNNWARLLVQIATEAPPPLSELETGLPAAVCELVMELLAKTPADRPEDAAAVRVRAKKAAVDLQAGGTGETGGFEETVPPIPREALEGGEAPTGQDAAPAPTAASLAGDSGVDVALAPTAVSLTQELSEEDEVHTEAGDVGSGAPAGPAFAETQLFVSPASAAGNVPADGSAPTEIRPARAGSRAAWVAGAGLLAAALLGYPAVSYLQGSGTGPDVRRQAADGGTPGASARLDASVPAPPDLHAAVDVAAAQDAALPGDSSGARVDRKPRRPPRRRRKDQGAGSADPLPTLHDIYKDRRGSGK